jgi:hypothetical protein
MRSKVRLIPVLALAGLLAAACGAATATQTPTSVPTAFPSAAPTAPPLATPEQITAPPATAPPTPMPTTDGQGDEVVRGEMTLNALTTDFVITKVGDVSQYRGGVLSFEDATNDPRVNGTVTFEFGIDVYTTAGSQWGKVKIENEKGAWTGTCTGGTWGQELRGLAWSCWLTGSGAYDGYSYYRQISKEPVPGDAPATVVGVVYPGPIPTPAP